MLAIKRAALPLTTSLLLLFTPEEALGQSWYDPAWSHRQEISISASLADSDLTNFPYLVKITDAANPLFTRSQLDGDDLLVTASDGTTKLDHEIERFDTTAKELLIWVRIPSLSASSSTNLYLYYGNASASSQQTPEGVWDSDFVMVQHLDETSGNHLDATANNNDGTPFGGVVQAAAGQVAGADQFDGSNDYINVPNSTSLQVVDMTLEAWVYIPGTIPSGFRGIVQHAYSTSNWYGLWKSGSGDRFHFRWSTGSVRRTDFATTISPNTWYHVVGVLDVAGNTAYTYLNGNLDSTINGPSPPTPAAGPTFIGAALSGPGEYFAGIIDEVRISKVARSAAWIAASFRNQNSPGSFQTVGAEEQEGMQPYLTSAADQAFTTGDPATAISTITIIDASAAPTISATGDIRIRIPAGLKMRWDVSDISATFTGPAAGKVSGVAGYEDSGKTLVLDVASDFAAGDQISIADLNFTDFTAPSPASNLELEVDNLGTAAATDTRSKTIASNQAGCVADPVTTVTELRAAIADPDCNTLNVLPGFYSLPSSGSGELVISRGVTIRNTGGGRVVISADGASRVFFIKDVAAPVTLSGLTITGGNVNSQGGGIYIENSTVTVTGSTVSGNTVAAGKNGGGIFTKKATLQLTNVTVSGNSAPGGGRGGGIYQEADFLTLTNTTVSGNVASDKGGGIYNKQGTLTVANALVANNEQTSGDQLFMENATLVSNGYNLVEGGCVGCSPSDLVNDPSLGPLADNGGDSYTHALLAGSPAINAGLGSDAPATDQRGIARPQGAASDIGAFEAQAGSPPTLSSAANQAFWVGKAPTAISTQTITDAAVPVITAGNDIRIRIPSGFNMSWDISDVTATIGGAAASKVSSTVSYEDGGKTLVLDVTDDFASADQISISDLSFVDFPAISSADNLELEIYNDGSVSTTDDKTIEITSPGVPTISSEFDQSFRVGSPPITMSKILVVDDSSKATITASNDIRIRIPAGFAMEWDVGDTNALILGTAAAKVSNTVSYEDGGKTLVIDVLTDFAAGDILTIQELSFHNFTAQSPDDHLELEVLNDGSVSSEDDKVIFIVFILATPHIASADDQIFAVGNPPTAMDVLRITDDPVPQITAANDIRIRIPAGFAMTWDTTDLSPTLSGRGRGKVADLVTYEDGGKTLVIDVLTDFGPNDWLNVKKLSFMNFASASPAARLQLDVYNDGIADALDERTKLILGPSYDLFVSPISAATEKLPSNGTNYTADFSVTNLGSIVDDYHLLTTTTPGGVITVISITGTGITQGANPDSARLAGLAPAATAVATVTYSVSDVALGSIDTLAFTARSVGSPPISKSGRLELTVIRPDITLAKSVNPTGTQIPGTDLTYTITITNAGSEDAVSVVALDSLAAEVEFKVGSVVSTLPSGIGVTVEYSNDGGATWTYTPVSAGCAAPADYDACVNQIRWSLQDSLGYTAPDNSGEVQFVARIK